MHDLHRVHGKSRKKEFSEAYHGGRLSRDGNWENNWQKNKKFIRIAKFVYENLKSGTLR